MDNTGDIAEIIAESIDSFFTVVDVDDFETDDLAYAIIRHARDHGVRITKGE